MPAGKQAQVEEQPGDTIADPKPASPSFATLRARTPFGDVIYHIDSNANTSDIDALNMLVTYEIDALREMSAEDAGGYFIELPALNTPAGQQAASNGIVCGKCGSSKVREKQATDHPKAPRYKCLDCEAVVWQGNSTWVPGKPRPQ